MSYQTVEEAALPGARRGDERIESPSRPTAWIVAMSMLAGFFLGGVALTFGLSSVPNTTSIRIPSLAGGRDDCRYNNYVDGVCNTPMEIANKFLFAALFQFDKDEATKYLAPNYIQHDPFVPTGAAVFLAFLPLLQKAGLGADVHRSFEDGNLVAYHSTYTNAEAFGAPTLIAFDVFRVEDGMIQEHWDNLQPPVGRPNPSGHTMTGGPTEVTDLDMTDVNRQIVLGLIEEVFIGGAFGKITDYISDEKFIQHDPNIADGVDALVKAMVTFAKLGKPFLLEEVKLVVADGNFVMTGCAGFIGDTPTAFYDLFRLEDGFIVEHWDVNQEIPPEEAFKNSNGKF